VCFGDGKQGLLFFEGKKTNVGENMYMKVVLFQLKDIRNTVTTREEDIQIRNDSGA